MRWDQINRSRCGASSKTHCDGTEKFVPDEFSTEVYVSRFRGLEYLNRTHFQFAWHQNSFGQAAQLMANDQRTEAKGRPSLVPEFGMIMLRYESTRQRSRSSHRFLGIPVLTCKFDRGAKQTNRHEQWLVQLRSRNYGFVFFRSFCLELPLWPLELTVDAIGGRRAAFQTKEVDVWVAQCSWGQRRQLCWPVSVSLLGLKAKFLAKVNFFDRNRKQISRTWKFNAQWMSPQRSWKDEKALSKEVVKRS